MCLHTNLVTIPTLLSYMFNYSDSAYAITSSNITFSLIGFTYIEYWQNDTIFLMASILNS